LARPAGGRRALARGIPGTAPGLPSGDIVPVAAMEDFVIKAVPIRPLAALTLGSSLLLASLALAPAAAAHAAFTAGPYSIEVGWLYEPTYVGQPNAVQLTIHDKAGKPVTDLGASDVAVVVSTAGTDSPSLSFDPAFDLADGGG